MWYISLLIFVFGITLAFFNIKFSYWKRKEISSYPAIIPWGSFRNIIEKNIGQQLQAFHGYFRFMKVRYGGIYLFTKPIFLPVSDALIRHILNKDFMSFSTRCTYHNYKDQKISGHLYNLHGNKWRKLSKKVKSILTSQKIKLLLPTLVSSYLPLVGVLESYASQGQSVDTKKLVENITRDVFTSCVLGIDSNEDFKWFEDKLFEKSKKDQLLDHLKMMYPYLARYYRISNYPQDAEEFFAETILKYIKKRHKNSISHTDFLQLLMELHNHDHDIDFIPEEDKLDMYDIINQCFFFYVHGFQTSVNALSFALYELAKNQYVQNKIRVEIYHLMEKHLNIWGNDELAELKYLEQVLKEILRKYPPIKVLERKCTRKYKLPQVDKYVERGTNVLISILGLHKDEAFYPEPEKFDPDRFSEKNKERFEKHCVYLPFGEGRRSCPGQRFAMTQLKVALIMIIQNFQFYLTPGGTNPLDEGLLLQFHKVDYNRRLSTISCNFYC